MTEFNTGIYQIVNKINGKRYIGSSEDLYNRRHTHFGKLKNKNHHNIHLQHSYNKYGEENFKFEVIMHCSIGDLFFYEQKYADNYEKKELYNIREIVESNRGLKHSEESKKKMSEVQKAREHKHSEETKKKISIKGKNKIITKEQRKNMSEAQKGKKHTEETKKKMRGENNPMYGKPGAMRGKKFSKEHKEKIGLANKGKIVSEKTRKKLSEINLGKNTQPIKAFFYKTNEFVGEYKSIKECAEILNITTFGISHTLSKRQNHHKGYTFEYINKKENI